MTEFEVNANWYFFLFVVEASLLWLIFLKLKSRSSYVFLTFFKMSELDFIQQVKNVCARVVCWWWWLYRVVFGKRTWIYIIHVRGRLLWAEGTQWSISIFFFFLVSIHMEFLTIETVSYTFSLELYKQFKPPAHTTTSCCGRPKPQQSEKKEKWTTSWCPDWSGHCFSASSALQNSSGYQQLTTFLLYF